MTKNSIGVSAIALILGASLGQSAHAQSAGGIDEIVVTARKKSESLQDVPIAVSALGAKALDELGVSVFDDYLVQMPSVTAGGSGPGQSTIYIRGVASTTPNLTTAGVAGLAPNVALYLDEQPLSQPGRNLDVYAADLERVEVLAGPQGTLFGASSQAGVVRLITNKPRLGEFSGKADFQVSYMPEGEMSTKAVGVINLPLGDRTAVRGVFYVDQRGGYIDNVPGTLNASESARFRSSGTVRDNGTSVSPFRAGLQADADLSGVTFLDSDNSALVEEDINDTVYSGVRLSLKREFGDDWTAVVALSHQNIDSDGVFFADPTLGDLEVQRYQADTIEDEYTNINWTVEGRLGALQMLYTGAYTERKTDQLVDYADYLFVGQYLPYYICDGTVSYPGANAPAGTCQAPDMFVDSHSELEVQTHELRFSTPEENWVRATLGGFYSDLVLQERNDFTYLGSLSASVFGTPPAFAANFPFSTGFTSQAGPFPAGVIFRNDIERTDEQLGLFGEVTVDLTEKLAITMGARWYDIEVDLDGSANSSFCNSGNGTDQDAFGTDISDLYNGDGEYTFRGTCDASRRITYQQGMTIGEIMATDPALSNAQAEQIFAALSAPDKATTDGTIAKATLSYTPEEGTLYYATYSEGFRPGLLNRPGGAQGPEFYTVPFEVDTDEVTNYEIGWKVMSDDRRLRFNGSAFFVDIENLQTTIFDPNIVNLFFSDNAANAEVKGIEGDITYMPEQVEGLTIAAAFSVLDSEVTEVLIPTNDVLVGSELAFAPSFQGNIRFRYEWALDNGMLAHVMPQVTYSDKSYSDVIGMNKDEIDSWVTVNFRAGVTADRWSGEFFIDNVFDERAELSRNFVNDRQRATYSRPMTIGVRFSQQF
jgi:outer membrane receptor protein involved in Fe transport